jgi:hypothetical protein
MSFQQSRFTRMWLRHSQQLCIPVLLPCFCAKLLFICTVHLLRRPFDKWWDKRVFKQGICICFSTVPALRKKNISSFMVLPSTCPTRTVSFQDSDTWQLDESKYSFPGDEKNTICDNSATSFLLVGVLRHWKKADFSRRQNVLLIVRSQ